MDSPAMRAALFGDVFEIAVKRGVLGYLCKSAIVAQAESELVPWREARVSELSTHLIQQLGVTDDNELRQVRSVCEHLLLSGYGLGWTCIREYLLRLPGASKRDWTVIAMWCPLTMRDRAHGGFDFEHELSQTVTRFEASFALPPPVDLSLGRRGGPARADFLLLLQAQGIYHLLCLEFSLNVPQQLGLFDEEEPHLAELVRYVHHLEGRGVFSRISAEVAGEGFSMSKGLLSHLAAFTTSDKPLYKLCQGCSYTSQLVQVLRQRRSLDSELRVQVLAVTASGLEGVSARFAPGKPDVSAELVNSLGLAYRTAHTLATEDDEALNREIGAVYTQLARALPSTLRQELRHVLAEPPMGKPLHARISERVVDFTNPNQPMDLSTCLGWIAEDRSVSAFLGASVRETIKKTLREIGGNTETTTLRSLHEAAVVAGLRAAPRGRITALGLEGHPGIGKTTSVMRVLERLDEGFLFVYVSPRVVINNDVMDKIAQREGKPTGTLTLTTHSALIAGAQHWHQEDAEKARYPGPQDRCCCCRGRRI